MFSVHLLNAGGHLAGRQPGRKRMNIVEDLITLAELKKMAENLFGDFVKAVVDVEKQIMAVDAELHADQEAALIDAGSCQKDLWGINLYPGLDGNDFIEFDSMINVRPSDDNLSRDVESKEIREKIRKIVERLVDKG